MPTRLEDTKMGFIVLSPASEAQSEAKIGTFEK